MDFEIIASGMLIISNGDKVQLYDTSGKQIFTNVPSPKTFREMAYIHPPRTVTSENFETVVDEYLVEKGSE